MLYLCLLFDLLSSAWCVRAQPEPRVRVSVTAPLRRSSFSKLLRHGLVQSFALCAAVVLVLVLLWCCFSLGPSS